MLSKAAEDGVPSACEDRECGTQSSPTNHLGPVHLPHLSSQGRSRNTDAAPKNGKREKVRRLMIHCQLVVVCAETNIDTNGQRSEIVHGENLENNIHIESIGCSI